MLLTLHKRRRDFPRSSVSHFLSNWNNNNWHIFQASSFFGSSSRDGGRKFLSKKDEHHLTVITVCNFHLLSAKPRIFLTAGFFLCVFAGENGRAIQQCNIINFPYFSLWRWSRFRVFALRNFEEFSSQLPFEKVALRKSLSINQIFLSFHAPSSYSLPCCGFPHCL